jgi:hypothetical protein
MRIALAKVMARKSKVSVGILLLQIGLVRFEQAFENCCRNKSHHPQEGFDCLPLVKL